MCAGAALNKGSTDTENPDRCGDGLTWAYDGDSRTLTVSGTGDMYDYYVPRAPWTCISGEIENIVLPEGLTHIGRFAFSDCSGLGSVTIPSTVRSIGEGAFNNCETLDTVYIPASVKTIDMFAFKGCGGLKEINVDPDNGSYCSENGVLFSKDRTVLVRCPQGLQSVSVTVPDSVTAIGNEAFYGCGMTSVEIPDSVKKIGDWAFYGCGSLLFMTIPDSVTSIGDWAFYGCSSMTSVAVPDSVKTIGVKAFGSGSDKTVFFSLNPDIMPGVYGISEDATIVRYYGPHPDAEGKCGDGLAWKYFEEHRLLVIYGSGAMDDYNAEEAPWYGCRGNIECAILAGDLTHIGSDAFCGMSRLRSVTIPETVISIGSNAFEGCEALTSVFIPASVTAIGDRAFDGCGNLQKIDVDPANSRYSSEDGILYDKEKTVLIRCPAGYESAFVTVPGSVISICERAFYQCNNLVFVSISNSVETIGYGAFQECESLAFVSIPDSVLTIGDRAFYRCSSLTSLTIPGSVTAIGDSAFYHCDSLTSLTIPGSVKKINSYTFVYCTSLISVTISGSVTAIGDYAFYCCYSLTSLTIPDSVETINGHAFAWCTSLTSVTIPGSVTAIGNGAFAWCTSLTSVTIPGSVETICDSAFESCSSLVSVTIPGSVKKIDSYAFAWCTSLTSATIPGSVTAIGDYAFESCSSMTSLTILGPATMGRNAFYCCYALTSVTILGSVTAIGDYAFYKCTSLTSVTIPVSVTAIGKNAFGSSSLSTVHDYSRLDIGPGDYGIPNDATVISHRCGDDLTWDYTESDRTLTVGGTGAMKDCDEGKTPWQNYRNDIEKVELPAGLTHIGSFAFSDCSSLTSVTIPVSVAEIGTDAFCSSSLSTVHDYSKLNIGPGDYGIPKNATVISHRCGDDLIWDYTESDRTLTVSGTGAMYDHCWYTVTPWKSFCRSIENVVFSRGITHIGDYSFYETYELISVAIPGTVTSIGLGAFENCVALASVTVPASVETIADWAFFHCNGLPRIDVDPENRHYSSENGILYNKERTVLVCCPAGYMSASVTVPGSVVEIGNRAFSGSIHLTSVTMPGSVTAIGDFAFNSCSALTSVTMSESVTAIGKRAFSGCASLTSVTIPASVETIDEYAFVGCPISTVYDHSDLNILPGQYGLPYDVEIVKGTAETVTL